MDEEHLRRRFEKRRNTAPKSLMAAISPLTAAQFKTDTSVFSGDTMKARCKRLAGRTVVVGNTAFAFDKQGICAVKPRGRATERSDFNMLLKMSGVEEIPTEHVWDRLPLPLPPVISTEDTSVKATEVVTSTEEAPVGLPDWATDSDVESSENVAEETPTPKTAKRRRAAVQKTEE